MTRMRPIIALLSVVVLVVAAPVRADAEPADLEQRLTPEQLHATGLDTLSAEQLALLNRLLREDTAKALATAGAEVADAEAGERRAPGPA
ncbi:MAG: hypothetical protein J0L88_03930, partial [Xanthomonadales bacterium]|nr:hypothetical protein [Xanthomonadales bacterium]